MRRFTFLSLLTLLLVTAASVFGQQDTGTLLGTVVDPAGAVVPAPAKNHHMRSPAARKAQARRMKAYWAKRKKAKT